MSALAGLINNETGLTPDEMRQRLERDGWFGSVPPDSTTVQDLLDLIRREANGRKVLHPEDPNAQVLADREVLSAEIALAGIVDADGDDEAALKLARFRKSRPDLIAHLACDLEQRIDKELSELPETERKTFLAFQFVDLHKALERSQQRLLELERLHAEPTMSRIGWRIIHDAILAQRAVTRWLSRLERLGSSNDRPASETVHNGSGTNRSGADAQVRQLIKQALDAPTPGELGQFLTFATKFRRLAIWNAQMAYIQRPGARVIASEHEWKTIGRQVLPDAVPIIILWPFSPIKYVYELEDTGPPVDREKISDPFATRGEFQPGTLAALIANLKKQKTFRVKIEPRRQGFSYAGSAASQGHLPFVQAGTTTLNGASLIGQFAHENAKSDGGQPVKSVATFRITVNDRLQPSERFVTLAHELGHIFCGHVGGCVSHGGRDDESGWPDRRSLGKNEKEIEAEAVAFLVASRCELITRSAEYLKSYAEKAEMTKINIDLIVRAAARIERLAKVHHGKMTFKASENQTETKT